MVQIKTTKTDTEYRVSCPYNPVVIDEFRSRGGNWDADRKEWVFRNGSMKNGMLAVKEMFGLSEETVTITVAADDSGKVYMTKEAAVAAGFDTVTSGYFPVRPPKPGWKDGQYVMFGGYLLASRRGRDYRADITETLVEGTIPSSGGSVKNPSVNASRDAVFELEVRRDFAERMGLVPVAPPNPLAGFSLAELQEEINRRNGSTI